MPPYSHSRHLSFCWESVQDVSSVLQKDAVCGSELQLPGFAALLTNPVTWTVGIRCKRVLQALCPALPFSCSVYLVLMQAQLKLPAPILFNRLWVFVAVSLQTQLISCKNSQNSFQFRVVFSCKLLCRSMSLILFVSYYN